jgi:hypothetical protein
MTSAPVDMIRESVCNLQAFSVILQMSACLLHFFISAENWNAKYITVLLPGLSNMLLGCEIGHPSLDSPSRNQYMQGWLLPMFDIVTCNGASLNFLLLGVLFLARYTSLY